jgi:23S rRNA A2030 N6-methylase RlmJ
MIIPGFDKLLKYRKKKDMLCTFMYRSSNTNYTIWFPLSKLKQEVHTVAYHDNFIISVKTRRMHCTDCKKTQPNDKIA